MLQSESDPIAPYRDLKDELLAVVGGLERVQNGGQLGAVELDYKVVSEL